MWHVYSSIQHAWTSVNGLTHHHGASMCDKHQRQNKYATMSRHKWRTHMNFCVRVRWANAGCEMRCNMHGPLVFRLTGRTLFVCVFICWENCTFKIQASRNNLDASKCRLLINVIHSLGSCLIFMALGVQTSFSYVFFLLAIGFLQLTLLKKFSFSATHVLLKSTTFSLFPTAVPSSSFCFIVKKNSLWPNSTEPHTRR